MNNWIWCYSWAKINTLDVAGIGRLSLALQYTGTVFSKA